MSIKLLPEDLRSSVRSGTILFDLTRVVEELILNSLDAAATKVSVAVGVDKCYIKVVDNGVGIDRDGFVLLGERYATSKFDQLTDDTKGASRSFGFRGEALGSISDVSILEIVSKAHGRPNGYRKVIKGCKCLYLGIDDDRQAVGTTVIVRDLFYNQPVRRNYLQSSPKKVLHSVKECVLKIALVHLTVSFKVVNTESEDELLCTYPSDSPLPLLRSGFGIEISSSQSSLHEINVSNCDLKLSGYISAPCDTFSAKPFQYIYINSRFICKCPIHKLLNQLASNIDGSDQFKAKVSWNGKKSRSQTYPAYILNLICSRSQYDLTFEPSKASVEFKDWGPIIGFVEKAIKRFWSQITSSGNLLSGPDIVAKEDTRGGKQSISFLEEDFAADSIIASKRCRTHNSQDSLDLPSPPLKRLREESSHFSSCTDNLFSFQNPHEKFEMAFSCEVDNTFWTPDIDVPFPQDQILDNTEPKVDSYMGRKLNLNESSSRRFEMLDDLTRFSTFHKGFSMRSCSFTKNVNLELPVSTGNEGFEFQIDAVRSENKKIGGYYFGEETEIQTFVAPQIKEFEFGNIFDESDSALHLVHDRDDRYNYFADTEKKNSSLSSYRMNEFLKGDILRSDEYKLDETIFARGSDNSDWLGDYDTLCAVPSYVVEDETKKAPIRDRDGDRDRRYNYDKLKRRSHSAPPYYRAKKKFNVLPICSTLRVENPEVVSINHDSVFQESSKLRKLPKLCGNNGVPSKSGSFSNSSNSSRPDMKTADDNSEIPHIKMTVEGECLNNSSLQDLKPTETEDPSAARVKWRNDNLQIADTKILDILSGSFNTAGDLLVPKSISKKCLKDARVLQQIDRKFISVVAGGILALIDQHAADERIKLEELRQKVLSGELKTITSLDAYQELVLPEAGYELLQSYAEQIQSWGWICNVQSQNSRSFKRNLNLLHRQPAVSTLVAVPCILGVNLTDADLLEFLQQLSDSDGSSAIPRSVLRILNYKACRSAIMFGDRLLPSECSLIVEELKQTSLCFQCAHGRPTTVPIVNLKMLNAEISKLGSRSYGGRDCTGSWHGLHRHEINLERTSQRLRSAGGIY